MESQNPSSISGGLSIALQTLDPSQINQETYLQLIRESDKATSASFNTEVYKQIDKILSQFSKTYQAWSVTIATLLTPNINDKEYFHAASILKNKMMYDFAALRKQDSNVAIEIRDNLFNILQSMSAQQKPSYLINALSTALAILTMHLHPQWTNVLDSLIAGFSQSLDHAYSLLLVLKYLASDCDNDSIVIEDSLRESFFNFIDHVAPEVFLKVFEQWAREIQQQEALNQGLEVHQKIQKVKARLIEAFYQWIKLKLPDEVIIQIPTLYTSLLNLTLKELENKDENLENATDCVIELINLSRKKPQYSHIKDPIIFQVEFLVQKVDRAIEDYDEDLIEQLSEIFVELGTSHVKQIIETESKTIPEILLKLLNAMQQNIPKGSRRQVTFWKTLFKEINKIKYEDEKNKKLIAYEPILLSLLEAIILQIKTDDETFEDFNHIPDSDERFDDLIMKRGDFGRLIQTLGKVCGGFTILQVFLSKLKKAIEKAQSDPSLIKAWCDIECLLIGIGDLIPALNKEDIVQLKDVILLIFQLPSQKFVALRITGANLFSRLSNLLEDDQEQEIRSFIDFVIQGFDNRYSYPMCAMTFRKLSIDHPMALTDTAHLIIEKVIPNPANDWRHTHQNQDILEGLSAMIEVHKNSQECEALIKRVIQPLIIPLALKIANLKATFEREGRKLPKEEISESLINSIQGYLQLMGDFLKGCKLLSERDQNPFESLFVEMWPFVQEILNEFTHLDEIVEYTIRLVKYSMRILGRGFDQYLIPLLQIVIKAFEKNPLPGFIYAVEYCLVDYAKVRDNEQIFQESLNHLVFQASQLLTSLDQYKQHPDMSFDLFGMCSRYIRIAKHIFFSCTHLSHLLNMWIIGIGIEHKEAAKTHADFFLQLVRTVRDDVDKSASISDPQQIAQADINPQEIIVWRYLLENGKVIVERYVDVLLSVPSRSVVEKYVDVLVEISLEFPGEYKQQWFASAFTRVPENVLTEEEKQRHLMKILQPTKKDILIDNFDQLAKRARHSLNRKN